MRKAVSFYFLFGMSVLIAGCGQMGPLYLPSSKPVQQNWSPQHSPQQSAQTAAEQGE